MRYIWISNVVFIQVPPRQPRLRRDLIRRLRNVGRITTLKLCRSKLLVQEETPRQARNHEHDPRPLQAEDIEEQQRSDTNKKLNQNRGLGSIPKVDKKPQTATSPSISSGLPGPRFVHPPRQPRLRRDLIEKRGNVGRIPSLKLRRSKFLVQEENPRQVRRTENEPLPLQPEVIGKERRNDTNNKTNESRGLSSTRVADKPPQTKTLPSKQPAVTVPDEAKLPEKPKNTEYYCDVCLINTTRFSLDVRFFVTYQVSFANSLHL